MPRSQASQWRFNTPTYPTPKSVRYTAPMTFALAPFAFALLQALSIHAQVLARDDLMQRPRFTSKAALGRLCAGVRALEAFLRRVLILMALEMEPDLVAVERPENLARAKAKMARQRPYVLVIYPHPANAVRPDFGKHFPDQCVGAASTNWHRDTAIWGPAKVPVGKWLDRLDHLHALVKDPVAKARRLAFSLARGRHGRLMAPPAHRRLLHRWGREASAIHDAMAAQIMHKSRSRPPPLPPPRRGPKPMITVFW